MRVVMTSMPVSIAQYAGVVGTFGAKHQSNCTPCDANRSMCGEVNLG
jgi:hypothetical protein